MRILAVALALLACPASAKGWQVEYLAGPDDSPSDGVVRPDEAAFARAYVDNAKGERLVLDCDGAGVGATYVLRLFLPRSATIPPPDDAEAGTAFVAYFGSDPENYDLGLLADLDNPPKVYFATMSAENLDRFRSEDRVRLAAKGLFAAEFTLAGSAVAIAKACPGGQNSY
jgi:hypothetical protein